LTPSRSLSSATSWLHNPKPCVGNADCRNKHDNMLRGRVPPVVC
jgi:hypothetical protein